MSRKKQALSRRELLKALAALSGAVTTSSLLPEKWVTPEVGAGALPAHAQGTPGKYGIVECDLDVQRGDGWTATTHVWIDPTDAGIELEVFLYTWTTTDQPSAYSPSAPEAIRQTDDKGMAMVIFTGIPIEVVRVRVVWGFYNPADGSGSCQQDWFYEV